MDPLTSGFSQPLTAPLYPDPPYYYRAGKVVFATYEADTDAVAAHLPTGLTPLHDPVQCLAWVCRYDFSTLGPSKESLVLAHVSFEGEPYVYCPLIYVNSEVALASGRELWGWPKKLADLEYHTGAEDPAYRDQTLFTVERPKGKRLMTLTMTPQRPASLDELAGGTMLTLRHIPAAEAGRAPSVCELIATDVGMQVHTLMDGTPDLWAGPASLTMDSPSTQDPLHHFAPTRITGGFSGTFDITLPRGKVVKNYLT